MRSFASVAVSRDGIEYGRFEAVREPLPGTVSDAKTLAWFEKHPGARAATSEPEPIVDVWIDYYLRRFTPYGVRQGHHEDDAVFAGGGLCIKSYAAAITGMPVAEVQPDTLPSVWFGDIAHSHRAIDDTLGYANLLVELLGRSGS